MLTDKGHRDVLSRLQLVQESGVLIAVFLKNKRIKVRFLGLELYQEFLIFNLQSVVLSHSATIVQRASASALTATRARRPEAGA